MTQEKVEIVATARDQASATLNRLNKNVAALGSKGRGPLGGLLSGLGGISPVAMAASASVLHAPGAVPSYNVRRNAAANRAMGLYERISFSVGDNCSSSRLGG